ncbi:MAG: amidohydrolase [Deltaproteobacteria bacterium]|nr:amidohydrolase [Deltaproteobacteria bacterium]
MDLSKRICELAEEIKDTLIKYRRKIHNRPELSGCEEETATYVAAILEASGIDVRRNVGGHGVVGLIKGKGGGKTIAIRADMDALPLQDAKETDYASEVEGVMHSCGHDVHTAILLGVATVLSRLKGEFDGSVKLIFQPSEEEAVGGADAMIEDGALDNPSSSAILALHVMPELQVGTIGCKSGVMTASSDRVDITIHGMSGHAARPHQTIDAILVSSHVVSALQHIISRRIDPLHPAVITIGTISGGTVANIVADTVEMTGTVRSLNPAIRDQLPDLIEQVVKGITESMGAGYDFTFTRGNPSVVNDETLTSLVMGAGRDILGSDKVIELTEPTMGGEDFSLFTEKVPGTFIRLGVGNNEKGIVHPLHHILFDIDEDALPVGVKVMAWSALSYLSN